MLFWVSKAKVTFPDNVFNVPAVAIDLLRALPAAPVLSEASTYSFSNAPNSLRPNENHLVVILLVLA